VPHPLLFSGKGGMPISSAPRDEAASPTVCGAVMQALEDSAAAFLRCFRHKPSSVYKWLRVNEVD